MGTRDAECQKKMEQEGTMWENLINSAKKYKENTELVPLQAWCLCPPLRSLWENGDHRENWEQSKKKNVLRKPMVNLRVS